MHEYGLSFARSLFWRTLPRVVGMLPKPINCAEIVIRKLPWVVPRPLGQWRTTVENPVRFLLGCCHLRELHLITE